MDKTYINSRPTESFCKLRSNYGLANDEDIHGMLWNERAVLEVTAFDRTAGKICVKNCNGLEWVSSLKEMSFCNEDGSRILTN